MLAARTGRRQRRLSGRIALIIKMKTPGRDGLAIGRREPRSEMIGRLDGYRAKTQPPKSAIADLSGGASSTV
jgi:hypothetical protein